MQAMKLFMGALAMANALEVDTESGPNKIQVAAQPNNAGVVSKTIKLATAAGVSAMAVDAINKLGTFETSPSGGDDPCQEPKGNKCVLCKPGFFLTVAGDCKKECPTGENPFWCPYQYCVASGAETTTAAAACGTKKVTEATQVNVFNSQCQPRVALPSAGQTEATCTYCKWQENGGSFYKKVDCDLGQSETYNLERVGAELGSFASYFGDAACPAKNCITDLALQQKGWTSLPKSVAQGIEKLIAKTDGDSEFVKFSYFQDVGPIEASGKESLGNVFKKFKDGSSSQIFIQKSPGNNAGGDPAVTSLPLGKVEQAKMFFNLFEIQLQPNLDKLEKLPKWICSVPRAGAAANAQLTKINFKGSSPACAAAKANTELTKTVATGGINGCNTNAAKCCQWNSVQDIERGCGQQSDANLFEQ